MRSTPALGLRANAVQFGLLMVVNAMVGVVLGVERAIMPALAQDTLGVSDQTVLLSFIGVFGLSKAVTNYGAGRWADRVGRKAMLVTGWLIAAPVPALLMWAPSWSWVLVANLLLGISQGLTWSTTVIMKIDLAGPTRRGLAMGLNELAGYVALALTALATAEIASHWGLRPWPFVVGAAAVAAGAALSVLAVRDTTAHAALEARSRVAPPQTTPGDTAPDTLGPAAVFARTTWSDRNLSAVTQAGLVNNLNDGMAWGLFPLIFASAQLDLRQIGVLTAIYPGVWGVAQLATGALSDRVGRRGLIASGMAVQSIGIAVVAVGSTFFTFASGSVLLGLGTAMVYPTMLAAIGDAAHPAWRGGAIGVYRLWRDLGYAGGALLAGMLAKHFGAATAALAIAGLTLASGAVVAFRMTQPRLPTQDLGAAARSAQCLTVSDLLQLPQAMLIDVRSATEFAQGHVRGATNIPIETLSQAAESLPAHAFVVTICATGGERSTRAAALLRDGGFAARSLCGGLEAWSRAAALRQ